MAVVIDLVELHRDALGIAMAAGRGRIVDGMELAKPYLADGVRTAALVGSLGGLVWRLATELADREGTTPTRLLQELSIRIGEVG